MPAVMETRLTLPRPHPGQQILAEQAERYNVVGCGRRWGKTVWGVDRCIKDMLKGAPAGWFAPSYKYVQEVWRDFNRHLNPIITQSNSTEKRIELSTGGSIEFWSLDRDEDAGRSRAYKVAVVDEAAKIPTLEPAWNEAIRATLADYSGTAWFLSTPKGKNFFEELFRRGEERDGWASWQMPTWTNPHIAGEEIEAMREDMPSRVFAQEVEAKFIEEAEGALWKRKLINNTRESDPPAMKRIVVAVDPAVTSNATSDETGIIVAGLGVDGEGYVLEDDSGKYSPDAWARRIVTLYRKHEADRVVAEVNNGGDFVESVLRTVDETLSYKEVRATRGKQVRAEPVAALYEQGRVHHKQEFDDLELQMTTWDPATDKQSPDRVDALVWALTELMLNNVEVDWKV